MSLEVYVVNITAGPNGIVIILIVFGVIPQMLLGFSDVMERREIMSVLKRSSDEMVKAVARNRLSTQFYIKVPSTAYRTIRINLKSCSTERSSNNVKNHTL